MLKRVRLWGGSPDLYIKLRDQYLHQIDLGVDNFIFANTRNKLAMILGPMKAKPRNG